MFENGACSSTTIKAETPCGDVFVTIREHGARRDFVTTLAKAGGCVRAQTTVAWQLSELAVKHGAGLADIAKIMAGHGCHLSSVAVPSCVSAIAGILLEFEKTKENGGKCHAETS